MAFNPDVHHRRSIRLKDYDYTQHGAYFITICTRNRERLLGSVQDGQIVLNDVGNIVESVWQGLPNRFPSVGLDAYVIMPNHVHGIIAVGAQLIAPCPVGRDDKTDQEGAMNHAPTIVGNPAGAMNHAPTLGNIVRTFKAASTNVIRKSRAPAFAWQRNYHEHIIRDERSLNGIHRYIQVNPLLWLYDRENPQAVYVPNKEVNRVLAKHYNFTNEDLDFIINYDVKYRLT
jgi:REP element-mobilizing transposase RayT